MAAARSSALRHLTSCCARAPRVVSHQQRWAQVHDVRFLATTQHSRSVLEKYRDKLDRKAREEGLPDIDTLKQAYADKIEKLRKEADTTVSPAPSLPTTPPTSPSNEASPPRTQSQSDTRRTSPSSSSTIKPLSAILNLPKVRDLPVTELTAIWRLRHAAEPQSMCAVIPAAPTYAAMESTARLYPQFVLPVPHPEQGAEMHFLQWTWDAATRSSTVLFTQLAEYKARGEFAQPHTTLTHYTDLGGEKGVVLMLGHVMEDRGVQVEHARWLVLCLQRFYGGWDAAVDKETGAEASMAQERAAERRRLLEWFAKGDERFSVEKLMDEAERMG
ncbi:ATP11 protein-domain-containing protein [Lasiosphaeria hispida]|uniref:ATP11 protein-domain-containing protein n=1 Tax=Lasiosphaeria hispida TaxID=260671 RepID=A0AAJ0MIY1_9PEZI|nr:ATP11 protein-domain-containing protein [Lasiosphaeria hispida]